MSAQASGRAREPAVMQIVHYEVRWTPGQRVEPSVLSRAQLGATPLSLFAMYRPLRPPRIVVAAGLKQEIALVSHCIRSRAEHRAAARFPPLLTACLGFEEPLVGAFVFADLIRIGGEDRFREVINPDLDDAQAPHLLENIFAQPSGFPAVLDLGLVMPHAGPILA